MEDKKPISYNFILIESENGWLTPDGKFYNCEYISHIETILALKLGLNSIKVEKLNWVKIQNGEAINADRLNQKQIDLLFDWHFNRSDEIPWYLHPKGFK